MNRLLLLSALSVCLGACTPPTPGPTPNAQGKQVSLESLTPTALPYQDAQITMKGLVMKGVLERKEAGSLTTIAVKVGGQVLEEELYRTDGGSLAFAGSSIESFDPPLLLAKDTLTVPGSHSWKGSMTMAGKKFPAEAEVQAETESLNVAGGPYESVRVTASLTIDADAPKKVERKLVFWLAPGKGIVKRAFDDSSERVPLPEPGSELSEDTEE